MTKSGPIVIVEDDIDDQDVLRNIFEILNYGNEIVFLSNGEEALDYFARGTSPFLILSDINMPRMDGFELRRRLRLHENSWLRDVPFLFFSTGANRNSVKDAYALAVQGFFIKPSNFKDWEEVMKNIIDYWKKSVSPNQYE